MLLLQRRPYLVRELPGDLDGVDAGPVLIQALPLGDPTLARIGKRDEALEDLRCAALDELVVVLEVEEVVAVRAAFRLEALSFGVSFLRWGHSSR